MHGLAVRKKDDPQKPVSGLRNRAPPSDAAVSLNYLAQRRLDCALNPLHLNRGSIRTLANRLEVGRRLQEPTLPEVSGTLSVSVDHPIARGRRWLPLAPPDQAAGSHLATRATPACLLLVGPMRVHTFGFIVRFLPHVTVTRPPSMPARPFSSDSARAAPGTDRLAVLAAVSSRSAARTVVAGRRLAVRHPSSRS